jgi:hypothetical protein
MLLGKKGDKFQQPSWECLPGTSREDLGRETVVYTEPPLAIHKKVGHKPASRRSNCGLWPGWDCTQDGDVRLRHFKTAKSLQVAPAQPACSPLPPALWPFVIKLRMN